MSKALCTVYIQNLVEHLNVRSVMLLDNAQCHSRADANVPEEVDVKKSFSSVRNAR